MDKVTSLKIILVAVVLVTLTLSLSSLSSQAQEIPSNKETKFEISAPNGERFLDLLDRYIPHIWVVRVYFNSTQQVADIAAWIEPWEVNYQEGYLIVGVSQSDFNRLIAQGLHIEIDHKYTQLVNNPMESLPNQVTGIPGYSCYRTVEETYDAAQMIVNNFPLLAAWIDIGDSWEKVTPGGLTGYDLMVLKLTNSTIPVKKPKLFIMSAIHAREFTTAELNTRFAEYLVNNYDVNPDVTWLLDHTEIHLLLQSNPDGRKQAEIGLPWRKNTNENYCSTTSTYRGADLNRNFEFQWNCCGGSSGSECDLTYRGPTPGSEHETKAIQNYVKAIFPDQRTDLLSDPAPDDAMGIFMDIHSYGELVLWPWGFSSTETPNGIQLQTLGRKFAYFNNYDPQQAVDLYPTDGTTVDFAYGELGLAAYAFELGSTFLQSCADFENTIFPNNLPALIYAAKTTRTPYLTPAGPDVLNLSVMPNIVAEGNFVTLTARIDDTRFDNTNGTEPFQAIKAAEYTIDIPPWEPEAISYPLSAVDGNFNNSTENVITTLDTHGLSTGRHIIFMRGKDADENWGVVSAEFLYVIDPKASPILQGFVREVLTGNPLTATISANDTFRTSTNPATGFYQMYVISDTYKIRVDAENYGGQVINDQSIYDGQVIIHDFSLNPVCVVFADDVESGNIGWIINSPWEITSEISHSPIHSWSDSPIGNYKDNLDISITSHTLDLSAFKDIELDFWQICDTEFNWDFCHVEISNDGGTTWTEIGYYSGAHFQWERVNLPVSLLDNQPNARIRYRLTSDPLTTRNGWLIDDIRITGSSTNCISTAPKYYYLPIVKME